MSTNQSCDDLLRQVFDRAQEAAQGMASPSEVKADAREAFEAGCLEFEDAERLGELIQFLPQREFQDDALNEMEQIIEDSLGAERDDEVSSEETEIEQSGQVGLDAIQEDPRLTGRVESTGILESADATARAANLRAVASGGSMVPEQIAENAIATTADALGVLARFVPEDVTAATFVYEDDPIPEIQTLTVSYDVVQDSPQQVGEFQYLGETTPTDPELMPQAGGQNRFLEDNVGTRYSYCAQVPTGITTVFQTTEQTPDTQDLIEQQLPPDTSVVPGPVEGTFKPSTESPIVLRPPSDVAGIDTTVFENGDSSTQFRGLADICLYVEVTEILREDEFTVIMDLRGEGEQDRAPRVGVDLSDFAAVPRTVEGAFTSALQVMTDRSPDSITTDILASIDSNPDIVREANGPDEPSVAEQVMQFGDLQAQGGQTTFDTGDDGGEQVSTEPGSGDASELRDEEQMDLETAGGTRRLDQFEDDN